MHACPALGPRWDLRARPLRRVGVAFRLLDDVGSHDKPNFGAQSHGLHAHCLRFAAGVTPRPRKTRFRLVATLTGRGWLPAGFQRKVSSCLYISSSLPRLSLAHPKLNRGRYPPN
jgi:hypothetical protein